MKTRTSLVLSFSYIRTIFSVYLILFTGTSLCAQQANIWYFHQKAGLDFNTTPPTVLTNGAILTPTVTPGMEGEGVASICDNTGTLLFYTDGITVYNRNHVPMSNGTGLMGHPSSAQSAIVVPKPGSTTNYYLITAPLTNTTDGIRYNEINTTLNSGLGNVVTGQKNILLSTVVRMMEGIAAVPHSNGTDYWLITHQGAGSNNFNIYLVNSSGISLSNTTAAGYTVPAGGSDIGLIKSNSCYSQIAVAYHSSDIVDLLNFNNTTGAISTAQSLVNFTSGDGVYGLEFSPNGNYLYVTALYNKILYQFNISSGVAATIDASRLVIGNAVVGADRLAALQLAPNGKIYAANHQWGPYNSNAGTYTYLGAINAPDAAGAACNWVNNAIAIPSVESPSGYFSGVKHGLPTFLKSLVANVLDIQYTLACANQNMNFSYTFTGTKLGSVNWNFGDPASGAANTSTSDTPSHTYASTGSYTVTLTLTDQCGKLHTETTSVTIVDGKPTVTWSCVGSTITLNGSNPGTGNTGYIWYGGTAYSKFLSNTNTATYTGSPSSFMVYGTNAASTSSASYVGFGDGYPQTNNYIDFTANVPFSINSIQVKAENGAGGCSGTTTATFTLLQGATVLQTKSVTINCGAGIQTLALNMGVPAASGLRLQSNIGFYYVANYQSGTYPWRSNAAVTYVGTSTGTNGPFADWNISTPAACSAKQIDVDCSLPVELISFSGIKKNNQSVLYWTTASEENNQQFIIERSSDGIHFESIGTVLGKGTTSLTQHYTWTDATPLAGINYYRLKQVDVDGLASYAHIIQLVFHSSLNVTIYPNPSHGIFQLSIAESAFIQAEVYNTLGQLISENLNQINATDFMIDLSGESDGVYYLQLMDKQQAFTFKLIKR